MRVLGGEPGQRHGEVEPQCDIAVPGILETVELLVDLGARFDLGQQHLGQFDRRRVDGGEPVRPVHPPGRLHETLPGNHQLGGIIAETPQDTRLDNGGHSKTRSAELGTRNLELGTPEQI